MVIDLVILGHYIKTTGPENLTSHKFCETFIL